MRIFNFSFTAFDIAYDVLLLIVTVGSVWLLPYDTSTRLLLESLALIAFASIVSIFAQPAYIFTSILGWIGFLLVCILIVVVALSLEPVWWQWAVLVMKGQPTEAGYVLNSKPHANIILFIGLGGIYGAIAGMIRHMLLKVLKLRHRESGLRNHPQS